MTLTAVGQSLEIWTYLDGQMKQLYTANMIGWGISLMKDNGLYVCHPAMWGHFSQDCLYWEDEKISLIEFLDCNLIDIEAYTDEYQLNAAYNYFYSGDDKNPRGCFIDKKQISSYEEYNRILMSYTEGSTAFSYHPVSRENCAQYLDYDWNEVVPAIADAYHIEIRPALDVSAVQHVCQKPTGAQTDYGVFAITRDDTGEDVCYIAIPFSDFDNPKDTYYNTSNEAQLKAAKTGQYFIFQPWFGPGMPFCFTYDAESNTVYELPAGQYTVCGAYLLHSTITFDTDTPRTFTLMSVMGDTIATLLENGFRGGYQQNGDSVFIFAAQNSDGAQSYPPEPTFSYDIWEFSLSTLTKQHHATVQAAWITEIGDGYVKFKNTYDGEIQIAYY